MNSILHCLDLPEPKAIQSALRSSALIDIMLCEEPGFRCYDYQSNWSNGVSLAHYNNGSGDDLFVFFRGNSAVIKGFDHESPISPYARDEFRVWPNMYEGLPKKLGELLDDEAVERNHVTFCTWNNGDGWLTGPVEFADNQDDGASYLLESIHCSGAEHTAWIKDYYEVDLPVDLVESIFDGCIVDAEIIRRFDENRNVSEVLKEIAGL